MVLRAATSGKPERIVVTGASGTLGYNVVKMLGRRHPRTLITLLMRAPQRALFRDLPNVTQRTVNVLDTHALRRLVSEESPDAVVHCAASGVRPSATSWSDMMRLNVGATLDLFEASCELPDCHFVHVSTGMVYREQARPLSEADQIDSIHPYGASKAAADVVLLAGAERLKRRLTVIRPFSFTGPRDGGGRLFPSLLRCAQSGEPFEMSSGTQIRDFCAVQDVALATCMVLERPGARRIEIYNVGSGRAVPVRQIVEEVCEGLSLRVDMRFGARPSDQSEPTYLVADVSKMLNLGWRPQKSVLCAVRDLAMETYPRLLGENSALEYA